MYCRLLNIPMPTSMTCQTACAYLTWGAGQDACTPCNITWFPAGHSNRALNLTTHSADSGQTANDKILRVQMSGNWFSLFELPPGLTLDLSDFDVLHFEIWSPGVTNLSIKTRDYGPNKVWDAALDDIERTKALAFDDNLIPNQWSVIEIELDELFDPDGARNLGQMLFVDVAPNIASMPIYLSNIYFYKRN